MNTNQILYLNPKYVAQLSIGDIYKIWMSFSVCDGVIIESNFG